MIIYEALKKDHDNVLALLDRLINSADASSEERHELVNKIVDDLVPHARAEEAVFYNSLRAIPEAKGLIVHGYEEHLMAETLLRTLQTTDFAGAGWRPVAKKLKDALEHHIAEEESEIFATAKQLLAPEEAEAIGQAFEQMKPQVREGGFMQSTLDLIANVMPTRFSGPLRTFLNK